MGMRTKFVQRPRWSGLRSLALLAQDEERRPGKVEAMEVGRATWRRADDATTVATDPVPEASVVRPNERLTKDTPHRRADDRGGVRVDQRTCQDETSPTDGLRGPDQTPEIAFRLDGLEEYPAEPGLRGSVVEGGPPLGDDGPHAGGTRGQGDLPERLGRDFDRRNAGPASFADQPAGDGDDEELFAVEERLDLESALDGMDDVPHALDEEHPPRIAVCAIRLEASYLVERGLGVGRDLIRLRFMWHSPL